MARARHPALRIALIGVGVVLIILTPVVGVLPGPGGVFLFAGGMALLAAGMLLFTQIPVDGSYASDLLPGFLIIALGMALCFVPISIAALAGVTPSEAGLASGLINTSQQIGGALGIAALGSVVASAYRSNVDVSNLPPEASEAAKESVGAAIAVSRSLDPEIGRSLVEHAGAAFTDAFNVAMAASAVISILIGVVVLLVERSAGND